MLAVEGGLILVAFRFAPVGSIGDVVVLLSGSVAAALFLGTTVKVNRRTRVPTLSRVEQPPPAEPLIVLSHASVKFPSSSPQA
jgi:hypothetical protein